MATGQSNKKISTAAKLFSAMAGMFTKNLKSPAVTPFRPSKYRGVGMENPAGTKIRRAIARGNHGLVNKHGVIGKAIAEQEREKWLLAHDKPVIRLSTHV